MDTKERTRKQASKGKAASGTRREAGAGARPARQQAKKPDQRKKAPAAQVKTTRSARQETARADRRKTTRPAQQKAARPASRQTDPDRRRKTGGANTPGREERQRQSQSRRRAKTQNTAQRVIRPPREEVPQVIYRAPKPMRRGTFLWKLVSMAAMVAAVFLALSVFFRVETITVAGADKYTPWMIRQAAGVEPGDALLGIGKARVASRIVAELPYVDEVKVGIRLPGTVEIEITELQVTYSVEDENGGWWLIASDGRTVEQVTLEQALGYTRVEGLVIRTPQPGQTVQAVPGQIIDPGDGSAVTLDQSQADAQLEALIAVMTALESSRIIGEVARIDVTDPADIRLEYPQLLTVRLGDSGRMDYKVSYLAAAVEQLEDSQSGELDLTLEYREDGIFTPSR